MVSVCVEVAFEFKARVEVPVGTSMPIRSDARPVALLPFGSPVFTSSENGDEPSVLFADNRVNVTSTLNVISFGAGGVPCARPVVTNAVVNKHAHSVACF